MPPKVLSGKLSWLGLLLPFAALGWRLGTLADGTAQIVGAELAELCAPLTPTPTAAEDEPLPIYSDVALPLMPLADSAQPAKKGAHRGLQAARPKGVRISAERVLALAAQRVIPRGVPVPANGVRPAGMLLRGVNGLGIGVRDGDVLTEAGGVPAVSAAAVFGAVIAARSRHEREISGRIFRGSEAYTIVVEQPYELTKSP